MVPVRLRSVNRVSVPPSAVAFPLPSASASFSAVSNVPPPNTTASAADAAAGAAQSSTSRSIPAAVNITRRRPASAARVGEHDRDIMKPPSVSPEYPGVSACSYLLHYVCGGSAVPTAHTPQGKTQNASSPEYFLLSYSHHNRTKPERDAMTCTAEPSFATDYILL